MSCGGLRPLDRGTLDHRGRSGEHPHRRRREGEEDRVLVEGKLGKGITFEI